MRTNVTKQAGGLLLSWHTFISRWNRLSWKWLEIVNIMCFAGNSATCKDRQQSSTVARDDRFKKRKRETEHEEEGIVLASTRYFS